MSDLSDPSWLEDDEHPIPTINNLDVLADFPDGRRELAIIIASPMDASAYSQSRLLNKIQNYIHFIKSEKYELEFGAPCADLVTITVKIDPGTSPVIFELIKKCEGWVLSAGATLVVNTK